MPEKRWWKRFVLSIAIASFFTGGDACPEESEPRLNIQLAYSDVEAFPYQMGNGYEIAKPPGIAVEILSKAAQDIGIDISFIRFPNKRVQEYLKQGEVDGAFIFSFKKERLRMGCYPMHDGKPDRGKRIAVLSYYLYKNGHGRIQWDGQRFSGVDEITIGANSGYSIVEDLKKIGVRVEEAKTTKQNLEKLRLGRIDGFAAQDITVNPYIVHEKYSNIQTTGPPLKTKDYYLILSRRFVSERPEIAERLWTKISQIRDGITEKSAPRYKESK